MATVTVSAYDWIKSFSDKIMSDEAIIKDADRSYPYSRTSSQYLNFVKTMKKNNDMNSELSLRFYNSAKRYNEGIPPTDSDLKKIMFTIEGDKPKVVKGFFNKVFKFVGDAAKKVVSLVGDAAKLGILAPLKGAMKKGLDQKKIPHSDKLLDIAGKFDAYVIKKKAYTEKFEYLDPVIVTALIPAILQFFKILANKGTNSLQEQEMVAVAEKDAANYTETPEGTVEKKDNTLLYVVLAIGAIFVGRKLI